MADNGLTVAITALLAVGVLLLNLGAGMIQGGQFTNGILIIIVGVVLISIAVLIMKVMIQKIVLRLWGKSSNVGV